ncbi:uncharacterized protein SCHCODRAFT_01334438 [Schizophyllum commune H4-8]|uniref:uncharacterized protein n=1 Tax=Schizophyllum commune (strain H4-8 / FGSC 9210) TaxID=578458 RepID=UPI00215E954E|nr:uncharacterized protein SCHCODRAFT_01334438 [Schizophyllum commune H4-8]KAI5888863.1 hypothetical protein SCHCODRAFT_01334438 [Schizophyllum commune H4-8]
MLSFPHSVKRFARLWRKGLCKAFTSRRAHSSHVICSCCLACHERSPSIFSLISLTSPSLSTPRRRIRQPHPPPLTQSSRCRSPPQTSRTTAPRPPASARGCPSRAWGACTSKVYSSRWVGRWGREGPLLKREASLLGRELRWAYRQNLTVSRKWTKGCRKREVHPDRRKREVRTYRWMREFRPSKR